jgi:acetyl-CoA carboxylase carboxyl transferase subunit alpha
MATPTLPFLEPIESVRQRLLQLESESSSLGRDDALAATKRELSETIASVFSVLTPWQRCQVARHSERPYTLDYIHGAMNDFIELHGDRKFADDPAIVAGFAQLDGDPVAVIGHQKGRSTSEKVRRNFGMPRPEGYRKALRVMRLAARFGRPVITFIDTPGAYPGIDAEERGQAEAIASNLLEMARLPVPIVVVVTGEGGSGGALALGIGDRILMLEHAIYSVISPEGCAAILWKDQARAQDAAAALKITAPDLKQLGVIDEVIPEPPGGAHMDPSAMCRSVAVEVRRALKELRRSKTDALLQRRYRKFRAMGRFLER